MPQSDYTNLQASELTGLGLDQIPSMYPNPLTPPPEQRDRYGPLRSQNDQHPHHLRVRSLPLGDNTGAGMAQSQEDSMYLSPAATPEAVQNGFHSEDKDKMDVSHDEPKDGTKTPMVLHNCGTAEHTQQDTLTPPSPPSPILFDKLQYAKHADERSEDSADYNHDNVLAEDLCAQQWPGVEEDGFICVNDKAHAEGLAPVDLSFSRFGSTKPWSFSNRRLLPDYPSHVFQPFSRYSGTQQSDRQIYNVDVTILTVDMAQCMMSGYLLIRGLTPEHDTLQTYFTGEIIGGPSRSPRDEQYYTFRTATPSWGATEKTDLTHWARFPAWRSLSSHAKRDINFAYPVDGANWWEQENIFMRWKEHFLVPDHKTKSIAGASFEGFYYICLNQVQGRISGIYYHSKSEKYQQLELKHEGKPDLFNHGITPCIEFR